MSGDKIKNNVDKNIFFESNVGQNIGILIILFGVTNTQKDKTAIYKSHFFENIQGPKPKILLRINKNSDGS